jgi:diacylglycerol kinase family enzyme
VRVSLVHKQLASKGLPPHTRWLEALEGAGHHVADNGEVVIAVGGDGTITGVARHLLGRERPLLVVPCGTANNLASGLGLTPPQQPIDYMLRVLERHRARSLDVGLARGAWGTRPFYEGAGVGLFADALDDLLTEEDKPLRRAAQRLARFLLRHHAPELEVELDGQDVSGRYSLVEVMNVAMLGPNLKLGPGADPFDGLFDVVLIGPAQLTALRDYLRRKAAGQEAEPPRFPRQRASRVRVTLGGRALRLDGHVVRHTGGPKAEAHFSVLKGALEVWLPESPSSSNLSQDGGPR